MTNHCYLLLSLYSFLVMLIHHFTVGDAFFPSLGFAAMRLSIVCGFVGEANFLGLEFSF